MLQIRYSFFLFIICSLLMQKPARASCESLSGESHSFCRALYEVKAGNSCLKLAEDPETYQVCTMIDQLANGGDCASVDSDSSPSFRRFCKGLFFGFEEDYCGDGSITEARSFSILKGCYFGRYILHNYQSIARRRAKHKVLKEIEVQSQDILPQEAAQVVRLLTDSFPLIVSLSDRVISLDQAVQFFRETVRFVEKYRGMLLDKARNDPGGSLWVSAGEVYRKNFRQRLYEKKGSTKTDRSPCNLLIFPGGRIVIDLSQVLISDSIIQLKPLGVGSFKKTDLALDYQTGKPLAKILYGLAGSHFSKVLGSAQSEYRMKSRWERPSIKKYLSEPTLFRSRVSGYKIISIDKYSEFSLWDFTLNVLNNPNVEKIEGYSKDFIKIGLMSRILDELSAIHSLNIVHRDIKVENILVEWDTDGLPIPRIVDAGLSFDQQDPDLYERRKRSQDWVGTPMYMSPSYAAAGAQSDRKIANMDFGNDVWSMGLAFWEVWSGKRIEPIYSMPMVMGIRRYEDLQKCYKIPLASEMIPDGTSVFFLFYRMLNPIWRPTSRESREIVRRILKQAFSQEPSEKFEF